MAHPAGELRAGLKEKRPPLAKALSPLIEEFPAAAITQAWVSIETASLQALGRKDIVVGFPKSAGRIAQALLSAEILSAKEFQLYNYLREVRNLAAHSGNVLVSPKMAREYLESADKLIDVIGQKV